MLLGLPILKNSTPYRYIPLLGLVYLMMVGCNTLVAVLFGVPQSLGDGSLLRSLWPVALMLILISLALAGLMTTNELKAIRQIQNESLASWPQYSSEMQWSSMIEFEMESQIKSSRIEWGIIFLITGLVSFIGLVTFLITGTLLSIVSLIPILPVVWLMLIGTKIITRVGGLWNYRKRQAIPVPITLVGLGGFYDVYRGYFSLHRLHAVEFMLIDEVLYNFRLNPQADSFDTFHNEVAHNSTNLRLAGEGWGQVIFMVKKPFTYRGDQPFSYLSVRVPPHEHQAAIAIVEQFKIYYKLGERESA